MKFPPSLVGLAFWALLPGSPASAATYYVSDAGSDSANGTSTSTPWKTISKVNAVNFAAGDQILFRGGDTFSGNMVFNANDAATTASPITVASYGSGRATISAGTGTGIKIQNRGGFIMQNLNVTSPSRTANTGSGIHFVNNLAANAKLDYVRVDQVAVSGFGRHGIFVEGSASDGSKSGYTDVRITNSEAFNNARTGIYATGYWSESTPLFANANVYVGHCRAYDNPGEPGYWNHSGDGIFLEDVDGGTIEYCVAYNNGALCDSTAGGPMGIWAAVANNIVIQFNESHHNKSQGPDGGGFDFDGGTTNSVMQFNYSHDNEGAGYMVYTYTGAPHTMSNLTVRYNISQNDGRNNFYCAYYHGGAMANPVQVYNNVFYSDSAVVGAGAKVLRLDGNNFQIRNNILIAKGAATLVTNSTWGGQTLQGNNYWAPDAFKINWGGVLYTSLNDWRTATGKETLNSAPVGFSVDPALNNAGGGGTIDNPDQLATLTAYQLQAGSPMINAGLDLQMLFGVNPGARDFYGAAIPAGGSFDLGACEVAGGGGGNPSLPTLTAYYTLDNLTDGIQNQGGDGVSSNLSAASATATPTAVTGIIGGALTFDGNDVLGAFTASPPSFASGNAGANLAGYPFSVSAWTYAASSASSGAAFGISQAASSNRYLSVGLSNGQPSIGRRNTTQYTTNATGMSTAAWHNMVAVFNSATNVRLYVDGKLAATGTNSVPLMAINSLTLGGIYRSTFQLISPLTGQLDDVGLFYSGAGSGLVLTDLDVALINGLGRTGGMGLNQLPAARALASASVGATGIIGGVSWQRIGGLGGVIGDCGGTVAGSDAYIVTGNSGSGIRVFSAPFVVVHQAESLSYTASDTVTEFNDSAAGGGKADRLNANDTGDFLTYSVPITQAGTYTVKVRYKTYSVRGQFQLSVEGASVGGVVDQYGMTQTWIEVNLGTVAISATGIRSFTFTVIGKNTASSGYGITFDYIKLEKN